MLAVTTAEPDSLRRGGKRRPGAVGPDCPHTVPWRAVPSSSMVPSPRTILRTCGASAKAASVLSRRSFRRAGRG